jgi:hypothetical protein
MKDTSADLKITEATMDRFLGMGFTISFPGNMDPDLWRKVRPYRKVIEEVYASLHSDVFPGGRSLPGGLDADAHLAQLVSLGRQLAEDNVALDIVLNTTPPPDRVNSDLLFEQLDALIDVVTVRISVTDFAWAHRLRAHYPDVAFHVSVLATVQNQYQAQMWKNHIDVEVVTVDRDINKKPERIRQIRDLGVRTKAVMTDSCMPSCPYYSNHMHVHCADTFEMAERYHFTNNAFCRFTRDHLPLWHMLKKEILPFHLPRYEGILDIVKLCNRVEPTEVNLKSLERYLLMETNEHPDYLYREQENSLDKLATCNWACASCNWCQTHIDIPEVEIDQVMPDNWEKHLKTLIGPLYQSVPKPDSPTISGRRCLKKSGPDMHEQTSPRKEAPNGDEADKSGQQDSQAHPTITPGSLDYLITSIRSAQQHAEAENDHVFLSLLPEVIQAFRPFLRHEKALPNGFYLGGLSHYSRGSVGLKWCSAHSSFDVIAVPMGSRPSVSIKGKRFDLLFLLDENTDPQNLNAYRESESYLADVMAG